MGYEITYKFHERQEDGKYNTAETKELKKRAGKPTEDVPLERLAALVMAQLARLDIWVVDVEIYEFTKKKLNFKESPGGIIIKGKKFALDQTAAIVVQDLQELTVDESDDDDVDPELLAASKLAEQTAGIDLTKIDPAKLAAKHQKPGTVNLAQRPVDQKRVLMWVIFEPDLPQITEAKQKGYKFTKGKRYPVHQVSEHPLGGNFGSMYALSDDDKKLVKNVDEKYFINAGMGLVGDNEVEGGFSTIRDEGPRLSYSGELRSDPQIMAEMESRRQRVIPPDLKNIPVDDGGVPENLYAVPELRPGRRNLH